MYVELVKNWIPVDLSGQLTENADSKEDTSVYFIYFLITQENELLI